MWFNFDRPSRPMGLWFLLNFMMALLYAALSLAGQNFGTIPPGNVTAVWLASGLATAAVFRYGYPILPGVWLGSFLGNLPTFSRDPDTLALGLLAGACIGIGAAIEAGLGVYAWRRFHPTSNPFEHRGGGLAFVIWAALAACLPAATIGAGSIVALGFGQVENFGSLWLTWWLGDAVGVLVVAPLLLVWTGAPRRWPAWLFQGEFYLVAAGIGLISLIAFGPEGYPVEYLLIPLLAWAAFRFDLQALTLAIAFLAGAAIWGTSQGQGSFVRADLNESLLLLQAFVGSVTGAMLILAATLAEVYRAEKALGQMNMALEARVQERTAELQQAKETAEAANRAKSFFLASITHELRTPLAAMVGYVDLMAEGMLGPVSDEQAEALSNAQISGQQLLGLVNDTLDLSQIESGNLTLHWSELKLPLGVQETVEGLQSLAKKKHLPLELETAPDTPASVSTDVARLQQILVNLIGNALKFTDHGAVKVKIGPVDRGQWFVEVQDSGQGIPPQALGSIFEAFKRGGGPKIADIEGSGLGLSITQRLVEALGGTIEVQSQVGIGSRFRVILPQEAPLGPKRISEV
jgi:signal transduction histidine kinase